MWACLTAVIILCSQLVNCQNFDREAEYGYLSVNRSVSIVEVYDCGTGVEWGSWPPYEVTHGPLRAAYPETLQLCNFPHSVTLVSGGTFTRQRYIPVRLAVYKNDKYVFAIVAPAYVAVLAGGSVGKTTEGLAITAASATHEFFESLGFE